VSSLCVLRRPSPSEVVADADDLVHPAMKEDRVARLVDLLAIISPSPAQR